MNKLRIDNVGNLLIKYHSFIEPYNNLISEFEKNPSEDADRKEREVENEMLNILTQLVDFEKFSPSQIIEEIEGNQAFRRKQLEKMKIEKRVWK
jgi:hypothetical protein